MPGAGFVDHCITKGLIKIDPLDGLKLSKMKVKGHPTWTVDEVEVYRQHHASGTKARLALELLLQTGHARADVVRMGRFYVKDGTLSMKRQKTKRAIRYPAAARTGCRTCFASDEAGATDISRHRGANHSRRRVSAAGFVSAATRPG
jgi:hypothetical protein